MATVTVKKARLRLFTPVRYYTRYIQAGLLDRWGTSGQRPPLEENPQALSHRARPGKGEVGLPAGEGWADTGSAGNGGNVTSAGWPVILCDPIWHVSFRSGEASR